MASGQRGGAPRAQALDEHAHVLGPLALVPVVVDADDRRAIARAEAFDLEQRELARRRRSRPAGCRARPTVPRSPARRRCSAHDSVRHTCRTYLPVGRVKNIDVVGDDVLDLGRRAPDDLGDVTHRVQREVALLPLGDVERGEDGRLAPLGRIARADLLEPRAVLRGVGERAALPRAARARTGDARGRSPSSDETSWSLAPGSEGPGLQSRARSPFSSIAISQHDVGRADDGNHVGDQAARRASAAAPGRR